MIKLIDILKEIKINNPNKSPEDLVHLSWKYVNNPNRTSTGDYVNLLNKYGFKRKKGTSMSWFEILDQNTLNKIYYELEKMHKDLEK